MSNVSKVMKYMSDRPGQTVYVESMVEDLEMEARKVQQTINNARNDHKDFGESVEIVVRGSAWCYVPNASTKKSGKRMFEEVGVTRDGSVLLECEDGGFYRAVEL